jgi:amino acid permease
MNFIKILKHPSAFLPIVMSLTALVMVLVHITMHGAVLEADEGTAAHIFQLLMVLEVPVILFFAVKWLPKTPKQAMQILVLQTGALLGAIAPVIIFNL